MREMGYQIGRRHAEKLRRLSVLFAFIIPAVLSVAILVTGPAIDAVLVVLAVISGGVGLVMERWLFFAEAEHVSMLFYGREAA